MISAISRMESLANWELRSRVRMKPELAPMADLMLRLDNPHKRFRSIHVTGSKGKGSVCALLEAALHAAGWRVGRYASPHIDCLNERVSVRRKAVPMDRLEAAVETVLAVRDAAALSGTPAADASWFDVMTAAAFLCFSRQSLDWVVVEVGLGGRLDSTNVIDGDVAVITNVGLEHTDVLGPSVGHVAAEKAGIVKAGSWVVTGVPAASPAFEVVRAAAHKAGAMLTAVPCTADGLTARNVALARAVLDALGARGEVVRNSAQALGGGLLTDALVRSARLPGRLERLSIGEGGAGGAPVSVVLDGAHVKFALDALLMELRERPRVVMLGLSSDKDAAGMIGSLVGAVDHVVLVPLSGKPCHDPLTLAALAQERQLSGEACLSVAEGAQACLRRAHAGLVLVTGSLYLISEARAAFSTAADRAERALAGR